jgi:hypothetical protein
VEYAPSLNLNHKASVYTKLQKGYLPMDQPVLQNSTKFPPGYGDFALQSNDNVVCYFPRYLLEYMSPVFKDMFSLPEPNTSHPMGKSPTPPPLKLTENSAVIEALLEHIDPKSKRGLPIKPDVILELLEAAQKYQISTITKWFVGHVGLPQIDDSSETPVFLESFTVTHPQLTLTCALRFDFPSIGKTALRELAGCPASIIQLESEDLPSRVYKYQCQLREVRIERTGNTSPSSLGPSRNCWVRTRRSAVFAVGVWVNGFCVWNGPS